MNPYAQFLDGDPLETIADTPDRLRDILDSLSADSVNEPPAPGKWSARDILAHLADTEIVFAFRLRQTLAQERHVIQPFDQDSFAQNYAVYGATHALEVFTSVRLWNIALIRAATPEQISKTVNHPERGDMTFGVIVETMAGHDNNHVRQLRALTSTRG